ncbi:SRPBCC family protein [Leptospira sp. GIMC2001]|uniref:SRPBCC family protein n=1 Tax=Leptospira sp. GIMC2001 TaxID=1513297 RepID=UPI002348F8F9|nr:SRPBCC domain-containing protein [Leptospira sp. GIMC2001]WCL49125.1 SRPBCC domain-containing protein [Leptospira sp. GIMC2001]
MNDNRLLITREFAAPIELVFKAWTDTEQIKLWSCPKGFSIPFSEGEVVINGNYRTCMKSPHDDEFWLSGKYLEIEANKKIVFTHIWDDESQEHKHETLVTVTFAKDGDRTILTLLQENFASEGSKEGHRQGWLETLDNLSHFIENELKIRMVPENSKS